MYPYQLQSSPSSDTRSLVSALTLDGLPPPVFNAQSADMSAFDPSKRRAESVFSRRGQTPTPDMDELVPVMLDTAPVRYRAARKPRVTLAIQPTIKESRASIVPSPGAPSRSKTDIVKTTLKTKIPRVSSMSPTPTSNKKFSSIAYADTKTPESAVFKISPESSSAEPSPQKRPTDRPLVLAKGIPVLKRVGKLVGSKMPVIGVKKEGRVLLESVDTSCTDVQKRPSQTSRLRRPQISIVIPNDELTPSFAWMPYSTRRSSASATSTHHTQDFGTATDSSPVRPSTSDGPRLRRCASVPTFAVELPADDIDTSYFSSARHFRSVSLTTTNTSDGTTSMSGSDDRSSNYSRRSSMTSIDSDPGPGLRRFDADFLHKRTGSTAFSIVTPAAAGVYDDSPETTQKYTIPVIFELEGTPLLSKPRRARTTEPPASARHRPGRRIASCRGIGHISSAHRATKAVHRMPTPTLRDAQAELENLLVSMKKKGSFETGVVPNVAKPLPQLPFADSASPPIPAKSSRRYAKSRRGAAKQQKFPVRGSSLEASKALASHHVAAMHKPTAAATVGVVAELEIAELAAEKERADRQITASQAEEVIVHIMSSVEGIDNLISLAGVNKGFHRVYKRFELQLLRHAVKNENVAAWEFMETCQPLQETLGEDGRPATPQRPKDPSQYRRYFTESRNTLTSLKALILNKCQSFLRPETVVQLSSKDTAKSTTVDAALWRIWTFCHIFGGSRGREDDLVAQLDWLRGGPLAHQQTCTSSIATSESFCSSSVLLNAPAHFAEGNSTEGLSAQELYDMTEMWNCLSRLIQGLDGRTDQARQYGVFDETDVRGGDIDGEEAMLEEYQCYILTLGLEASLLMSSALLPASVLASADDVAADATVFALAQEHGWTSWTPPAEGASRRSFLKEPITRLYEERLKATITKQDEQSRKATEDVKAKQQAVRIRGENQASELKQSRLKLQANKPMQLRVPTTFTEERPMSDWDLVIGKLTKSQPLSPGIVETRQTPVQKPNDAGAKVQSLSTRHDSAMSPPVDFRTLHSRDVSSITAGSMAESTYTSVSGLCISLDLPADESGIHPALRPRSSMNSNSSWNSAPRSRSGTLVRPNTSTGSLSSSQRAPKLKLQVLTAPDVDLASGSAERAISQIVEMGFDERRAKKALMATDEGSGLRVDKAVELLLRQRSLIEHGR